MMMYDLANYGLEFQTNPVLPTKAFETVAVNVTNREARDHFALAASGVRGHYLLASRLSTSNSIVAQITRDSGATWSAPRAIRLGSTGGTSIQKKITASYTTEWVVTWIDTAAGLGSSDDGSDVMISTSSNGLLWTSPEVLFDGSNRQISSSSIAVSSKVSYVGVFGDANRTNVVSCSFNDAFDGSLKSVASGVVAAAWLGAVAAVAMVVVA